MKRTKKIVLLGMAAVMAIGVFSTIAHAEEYDAMDIEIQMGKIDAAMYNSDDVTIIAGLVNDRIDEIVRLQRKLENVDDSKGLLKAMGSVEAVATWERDENIKKKDTEKMRDLADNLDMHINQFRIALIKLGIR